MRAVPRGASGKLDTLTQAITGRAHLSEEMDPRSAEVRMDAANLHREDLYTDLQAGTLRVLTPVKTDGTTDPDRPVQYMGQTQLWTQMGPVPISAEIEATSIEEALAGFPAAMRDAIQRTVEEVRELRRQQASQIVVPEVGPGGKIQIP